MYIGLRIKLFFKQIKSKSILFCSKMNDIEVLIVLGKFLSWIDDFELCNKDISLRSLLKHETGINILLKCS